MSEVIYSKKNKMISMSFLKNLFGKDSSVEPLNDEIKEKISNIVVSHLDDYNKNYTTELGKVSEEWNKTGKNYTFPDLDQEAHNRAGVKSFKETVTNKTWSDVQDDVDKNIKTKTTNEMVIKASNIAGKKSVGIMVGKSVDEGMKKMSKKAEADQKNTNS